MSFPIKQLNLDPTGLSPANNVRGEQHTLGISRGQFHAIAPYLGPFYNDPQTWQVRRNGELLKHNVDYFGVVMCGDETMRFNGEIDEVFLIKGSKAGDIITVDLQYLGGLYQNYAKGLEDLWNAFLNDNRPIDWLNVMGKPLSWNPSYHLHMIEDVVGWQPVVIALERLTNAVILKNIPAFEALIDWVLSRTPDIVTMEEIKNMTDVSKMVTFSRLMYAARALNFNAITFRPDQDVVKAGQLVRMNISSTNFPRKQQLYWDVLHGDQTVDGMFLATRGDYILNDNEGSFYIPTNAMYQGQDEPTFRVRLRRESPNGPILCESKPVTLQFNPVWTWDYGLLENGLWEKLAETSALAVPSPQASLLIPDGRFWAAAQYT